MVGETPIMIAFESRDRLPRETCRTVELYYILAFFPSALQHVTSMETVAIAHQQTHHQQK